MSWLVRRHSLFNEDLPHYAERIAQGDVNVAYRFIDAVEETAADLAEHPYLSTHVGSSRRLLAGIRRRLVNDFRNHVLFISVDEVKREVFVWGLFRGSRDLLNRLSERVEGGKGE